jgi:hypothetical protein
VGTYVDGVHEVVMVDDYLEMVCVDDDPRHAYGMLLVAPY